MQAQTTGSRWFGFNWVTILALALVICALAIAAALVINDAVDLPFTSEGQAVSSSSPGALTEQHRQRYLEQKFQLPDISAVDPAQSAGQQFDQSGTTRANQGEHRATTPELSGVSTDAVQSAEQTRFLEDNIWEYGTLPNTDQGAEATAVQPETSADQLD